MDDRQEADHIAVRRLSEALRGEGAAGALDELAELLPKHFAFEERPTGFFSRMVELGHDAREAERLLAQHAEILQELTRVRGMLPQVRSEALEALAKRLEAHEWDETRYASASPRFAEDRARFGG